MFNMRTVEINDVSVNLYQVMLLNCAKGRMKTPYDRFSETMTNSVKELASLNLVFVLSDFNYKLTSKGESWLFEYERIKQTI